MKNIKCDKCGYKWETDSNMLFVTCPRCQLKAKAGTFKKKIGKNTMEDNL